tara:strand:- start:2512 stop:2961 length:450 start_codon:yes stop_codon:yes gene_type:complete
MVAGLTTNITTSGPLANKRLGKLTRGAARGALRQLVEMGEQRLAEQFRARPAGVFLSVAEADKGKATKGHYLRNIHGEVKPSYGRIHDSGVEYGPWLEGTSSRNATTRFKGYHVWRKTKQWLQEQVKPVLRKRVQRAIHRASAGSARSS